MKNADINYTEPIVMGERRSREAISGHGSSIEFQCLSPF